MEIKIACETKLYLPLENLTPFQGSLKDHGNKEKLKKQILEQGFAAPIFVWKNDGKYYILDGHGRCSALQDLKSTGYKIPDLPCVEIHAKTKREAKKKLLSYVSQFGKVTGAGLYEFITEAELDLEELEDFEIPEIDLEDFKEEFFPEDKPIGDGSEDEIPEVSLNELGVKLGDIFELGNHRLMCGDSTDLATVEKLMNGEKADMVFTDPPYKLETEGGCKGEIGKSLKKQGNSIEFIADFNPKDFLKVLPEVFSKSKMNSYVFCNKELLPDYLIWARENKYSFNVLIWKKPNAIPIGDSHRPDIEYLILFRKSAIWNNGLKDVNYSRCLEYGRENGLHPTMKPVDLISNEIKISSNVGSPVLDLFLGSGSTLIACEKTNRKCYGLELDPHYCSVIIKRWEEYTGKKHKKLT